ncbi:ABC transporter ATP-binding protein [Variovorax sp. GB1R11]|uniref:ABC transporter ATP-binding protein n=1 Tax=Variovorax sp. GB1R11 TaxID=3443741 RepID=UPI003F48DC1B
MPDPIAPDADSPASPPPVAVSIEGVAKRFGASVALHEVSLRVRQGEFLTLLGPSGCGKTTLLNLIAGFVQPDSGEIFIDGQLITPTPPHQREIGIVFQNYALFPHMTVSRNIGYGLRMRGIAKDEIARRVDQALALVKLDKFGERRPRELSGGQQQRVALARALVIGPRVLLLDEPFSALDKNLRGAMQAEVLEIQRKLGVTTVFVTHDQGEALSMSDRIAVMSQGHIRQIDTPDAIYRRPADPFVASFVGDVNVLPARCISRTGDRLLVGLGNGTLDLPGAGLDGTEPGALLDLYVRPESIRLQPVDEATVLTGTVVQQIFQGDHVNTYVDVPAAGARRLLVRAQGLEALQRWPVGAVAGIALPAQDVQAFAPATAA